MKKINLSDDHLSAVTASIEQYELTASSHLYKRFPGKLIGEAAQEFFGNYSNEAKEKPGLVLLSVILAAHRNYTKQVEPQIDRIRKLEFASLADLKEKCVNFTSFVDFAGVRDLEKYKIILDVLQVIELLKSLNKIDDDYEVMNRWAVKANYMSHKQDIIGKIKGIGIATFQHLRMNFGADTVKPDQRVKEVLNKEYKFYSNNDIDYIAAVEYIAKVVGKSALYVDQVMVNYGSGYYLSAKQSVYLEDDKMSTISKKEDDGRKELIMNNTFAGESKITQMIAYINDAIKDLDVFTEKRKDGGNIIVANALSHKTNGKNVATYWVTSKSVSVIILSKKMEKTLFQSVEEMEEKKVAEKINIMYHEMVG